MSEKGIVFRQEDENPRQDGFLSPRPWRFVFKIEEVRNGLQPLGTMHRIVCGSKTASP